MIGAEQMQRCEIECTRLCIDFAFFVDTFAHAEVSQLFVQNGKFERNGEVLEGRDAIFLSMSQRPKNIVTRHVCTNIRIEPQQNGTASGSCYLQFFHAIKNKQDGIPDSGYSQTIAEYQDVYVDTPEVLAHTVPRRQYPFLNVDNNDSPIYRT